MNGLALMLEGAVSGRSANPWKDKVFYSLTVSYGDGAVAKLDCTQAVYEQAAGLILKAGSYMLGLSARDFQGRTSLTVESISAAPAKAK